MGAVYQEMRMGRKKFEFSRNYHLPATAPLQLLQLAEITGGKLAH